MIELQNWLTNPNRNYNTGLQLYRLEGGSDFVLKMLSRGENRVTSLRLYNELKAIAKANEAKLVAKVAASKPVVEPAAPFDDLPLEFVSATAPRKAKLDVSRYPERLQKLNAIKGTLYLEASYTHRAMCGLDEAPQFDKQRKRYAEKIDSLFALTKRIYNELDLYRDTGREVLPADRLYPDELRKQMEDRPKDEFAELTPVQLKRKEASIMAMITQSKIKKNKERVEELTLRLNAVRLYLDAFV